MTQHIIIIGFKSAGKSSIGKILAKRLEYEFLDLDDEIIQWHEQKTGEKMTCRSMMKKYGDDYFRNLEHKVFGKMLATDRPKVLAVGGGTPMMNANRNIMKQHTVIHIDVPKEIIFERIMINGKPAFFPDDRSPFQAFHELWEERDPVFKKIASVTVENTGSVQDAVKRILSRLPIQLKMT
jgi:shikimate kinase